MLFAKYIHVLHLLSTIPAPSAEDRARYRNTGITSDEATQAWDHLFTYIHERWAAPATAFPRLGKRDYDRKTTAEMMKERLDCKAMLAMSRDELVAHLATLPPYFTEEVFPVAVARYLLRDLRLNFFHRKATTFTEFHRRYGDMILSSV